MWFYCFTVFIKLQIFQSKKLLKGKKSFFPSHLARLSVQREVLNYLVNIHSLSELADG